MFIFNTPMGLKARRIISSLRAFRRAKSTGPMVELNAPELERGAMEACVYIHT